MIEHRWSKRISAGQAVVLQSSTGGSGRGFIRNVCLQGLYVETDLSTAKNAYVDVQFCVGDEPAQCYRLLAMVVRQDNQGLGLVADTTHRSAADGLRALIKRNTDQGWPKRSTSLITAVEHG